MKPTPKNKTGGYTTTWKQERDRKMKFYQNTPYYGSDNAKKMYDLIKSTLPSLIQVSHCGPIVQLTTYKQDADKARTILSTMFSAIVKQTTCPYTEYITTYVINK